MLRVGRWELNVRQDKAVGKVRYVFSDNVTSFSKWQGSYPAFRLLAA